jgi:hypothetical protein
MEKVDQRQCCKGNLEKMNIQEEMSGETRRHHWNKKPRLKTAAMSEEGGDNWQRHYRMEQETTATTGKHGKC